MSAPPIRGLDVSFDETGRVDHLKLRMAYPEVPEVAYLVTIEPSDGLPYPTEIAVRRRRFIGPSITDIEERLLTDPNGGVDGAYACNYLASGIYRTDAEAWEAIERVVAEDLAVSSPRFVVKT